MKMKYLYILLLATTISCSTDTNLETGTITSEGDSDEKEIKGPKIKSIKHFSFHGYRSKGKIKKGKGIDEAESPNTYKEFSENQTLILEQEISHTGYVYVWKTNDFQKGKRTWSEQVYRRDSSLIRSSNRFLNDKGELDSTVYKYYNENSELTGQNKLYSERNGKKEELFFGNNKTVREFDDSDNIISSSYYEDGKLVSRTENTKFLGDKILEKKIYNENNELTETTTKEYNKDGLDIKETLIRHLDRDTFHIEKNYRYDHRGKWVKVTCFGRGKNFERIWIEEREIKYYDEVKVEVSPEGSVWQDESGKIKLEFSKNNDLAYLSLKDQVFPYRYSALSDRVILELKDESLGSFGSLMLSTKLGGFNTTLYYQDENTLFLSVPKRDILLRKKN